MSDTPEARDTAKIREAFIYDGGEADYYDPINGAKEQRRIAGDIFDRWLAAHDAEVRAGVVAEEPEWEYGLYDPATNDVDGCGTDPVTRESFTGVDWDATGEHIVRRRVAGPWVPVHD